MDDIDIGSQIVRLLGANAALGIINTLFSLGEDGAIIQEGIFKDADVQNIMSNLTKSGLSLSGTADYNNQVCAGNPVTVNMQYSCGDCLYDNTEFEYDYTISGVDGSDIGIPKTDKITVGSSGASLEIPTTAAAAGKTITVEAGGSTTTFEVVDCSVTPLPGTPGGGEGAPGDPSNPKCEYTAVPIVWCAEYHPTSGALVGVSVKATANFAVPQAGEATVDLPTSLTVSGGGTITVNTTTAVASTSTLGGQAFTVITNFNTVAPNGLITGTKATVYGYN
jgi:hypothetical protein